MRAALKVIPLGALGLVTALLVGCGGGGDKLLSNTDASSLQDALTAVQTACTSGDSVRAQLAAQRFSDRVTELSPREVDPRLIANLQDGATRLTTLAGRTCTETTSPSTTPTTPTTTTPTTPTTTTPTTPTTTPTTPTTTTPPPETTPTTPNGGGSTGGGTGGTGGTPGTGGATGGGSGVGGAGTPQGATP